MNLLCRIFGCELEEYGPGCRRCGADLYSGEFIQIEGAWLLPWYKLRWWIGRNRYFISHKCETCGKMMRFNKEYCCSDKCYRDWCPF